MFFRKSRTKRIFSQMHLSMGTLMERIKFGHKVLKQALIFGSICALIGCSWLTGRDDVPKHVIAYNTIALKAFVERLHTTYGDYSDSSDPVTDRNMRGPCVTGEMVGLMKNTLKPETDTSVLYTFDEKTRASSGQTRCLKDYILSPLICFPSREAVIS